MAEKYDLAVMRKEIEEDERLHRRSRAGARADVVTQDEIEKMWREKWRQNHKLAGHGDS